MTSPSPKDDTILAWHFVGPKLRDGREVPADGEVLEWAGKLKICPTNEDVAAGIGGLHASERIIDALNHAPGSTICRDECSGIGERHSDKFVCRRRTILWRVDGESLLREFARKQALSVIDKWEAPEIVRRWLETGDESIREAAESAAWSAAWSAAESAAEWSAAWSAAARSAAGSSAAGWSAVESAVWSARWSARSAAWSAAESAAAESAAESAANEMLTAMVEEARK